MEQGKAGKQVSLQTFVPKRTVSIERKTAKTPNITLETNYFLIGLVIVILDGREIAYTLLCYYKKFINKHMTKMYKPAHNNNDEVLR